ncbi:hypothetical protein F5Y17DRAFT_463944 [Xylariaceae sp. FL0594]|nr:hypothetical protein F5Y17DRAFT_463944 [Xylariaceae sp. FL0594]
MILICLLSELPDHLALTALRAVGATPLSLLSELREQLCSSYESVLLSYFTELRIT